MSLLGKTFGNLTVVEYVGKKRISNVSKYDSDHYLCECECGKQIEVSKPSLEYRIVKTCGCNRYKKRRMATSKG